MNAASPRLPDVSQLLIEEARVVEPFSGGAWVEVVKRSSCQQCTARQGCGGGLLARFRPVRAQRVAVASERALREGERVQVALPATRFLQGALVVYGVPLMTALLAGGLAEAILNVGHAVVPLAFASGLAAGWGGVQWHERRHGARFRPRLLIQETQVCPAADAPDEVNVSSR
ncbi:SoxR reducing system RseC family protein [Litchfieldella rifensis]|uniref:SoxR reducing system RseC family protein n=1 Tax=Litchfieldella rifensis TaxID=762643 RepID=A0ABV7LMN1_9GAMM